MEHDRYREWLDLAIEGELAEPERVRLDAHLAECAPCRAERLTLERLAGELAASRVAVRRGFAGEVMAALEPAPWEARTLAAWRLPFALLLALGGLAAALFGGAAAALDAGGRSFSALLALVDLFTSAALAGAGLAGASWRGLGLGVRAWLVESPLNVGAALVLLVGGYFLLFRLLRRAPRAAEARARR
jgi:predicted anti-sigma-YlaC factor YlaD